MNFNDNEFKDYTTRHANDYIFNIENVGTFVEFNFANLDVTTMILTNGPINTYNRRLTISSDERFYYAVDPLTILFEDIDFNEFKDILLIDRTEEGSRSFL